MAVKVRQSTGAKSSSAAKSAITSEKHIVTAGNAFAIWNWLSTRGGLAIWRSTNASRPGASWTTPANAADGRPTLKPSPDAADTPERVIADPAEVVVSVDAEVGSVQVCWGADGEPSSATAEAIYAAVVKAGEGAYFRLEEQAKEAMIYAPVKQVPITEWLGMVQTQRQHIQNASPGCD